MADNPYAGVGTAPSVAPNTGYYQEYTLAMRASGFSDAEIGDKVQTAIARQRGLGTSEEDIARGLGINDPTRTHEVMRAHAIPSLQAWTAPPAVGAAQEFTAGLEASSGGLTARRALPDYQMPENAGFWGQMAYQGGSLLGDAAHTIVGGAVGLGMGFGMGAVMGVPTGPGAAATAVGGAATGAMMGAFALPAMTRKAYMEALVNGETHGWSDWAEREAAISWEGIKAMVVGRVTGLVGGKVVGIGGSEFNQTMQKIAVETAAMTTANRALEGQVPTWTDLGVNGLTMMAMHAVLKPLEIPGGAARTVMSNLGWNWAQTGEAPIDAVHRAVTDQGLYQQLMLPRSPEPPTGSSETHVRTEGGVPDVFVVGRSSPKTDATAPPIEPGDAIAYGAHTTVTLADGTRADLPPDQPTAFEKGQTYYDYLNDFAPLRWSEGKQKWMPAEELTPEDWKAQENLHTAPAPNVAPLASEPATRMVWATVVKDGGIDGQHTQINRAHVLSGKYFDFRNPNTVADLTKWGQENGVDLADLKGDLAKGHRIALTDPRVQRFLRETGHDGYFEREDADRPVTLAVFSDSKIVRGEPTDPRAPMPMVNRYERAAPSHPEDQDRPGTAAAVYRHGEQPEPGSVQELGVLRPAEGGEGGKLPPPAEPPGGGTPKALPPTDADAIRAVAARTGEPVNPGWYQRMTTWARDAYRLMMNDTHPLMQLMQKAIERGVSIADADNPLFLHRLAALANSDAAATNFMQKKLFPIFKQFAGESGSDTFWTYALARTAMAEAIGKGRDTGVDFDMARQAVAARDGKYRKAFDQMLSVYNESLSKLVGTRITEAQYQAMVDLGDAGLPLVRVEDPNAPEHATTRGTGQPGMPGRRKGSELPIRMIGHPLVARILARERMVRQDADRAAAASLGERLGEAQRKGSGKAEWTPEELRDLGMNLGGLTTMEEGESAKTIANKLGWDWKNDDIITWENGQAVQWRFNDPGVARLYNNLDQPTLNIFGRMAQRLVTAQRNMMVVANPLFAPKITMLYDVLFQHLANPEGRNTVNMMLHGLQGLMDQKTWDAAVDAGAFGYVFKNLRDDHYVAQVLAGKADPAYTSGVWNSIRHPIDALRAWGQGWFHMMPMGRFAEGMAEGESTTRAAAMATNAVFDPTAGGGPVGRWINATTQPFFKAHLTNLERTGRAMFGIGHDMSGIKFDAADFALKALPFVTLPFVQSYLLNRDKQWYINAPDWQKNNGLLLRVGGDDISGTTVYFPFPPLIGLVFGGIPRMMIEAVHKHDMHAFDHLTQDLAGALAPAVGAFTYSLMVPVLEKLTNHSFFRGTPLNPGYMSGMLPQDQFHPYTTWAARKISAGLSNVPILRDMRMTPIEIDNFVSQWTGTAGRFVLKAAEQAATWLKIKPDTMSYEHFWEWPGLASFNSRLSGAQPIHDFHDRLVTNLQYPNSASKALAEGDPERFRELTTQDPAAFLLGHFRSQPSAAADPAQFLDSLVTAVQQAGANRDLLAELLKDDQIQKLTRQTVGLVANLPTDADLSDAQKSMLLNLQRGIQALQPGVSPIELATLSAMDKRQLMDRLWATSSLAAQHGLRAMDALGMK